MNEAPQPPVPESEVESTAVLKPKRLKEDTELDMTPMIDCTFLLLIFFMVTSTPDASTELKLAPARNGKNIVVQEAAVISLAENPTGENAIVYLADGKVGEPLPDALAEQEEAIKAYVRREFAVDNSERKNYVLIKAERGVKNKDTLRVSAAASTALDDAEGGGGAAPAAEEDDENKIDLQVAVLDQQ